MLAGQIMSEAGISEGLFKAANVWAVSYTHLVEAIFCANDLMALGVMDCGRLKYKYVPGEDYSKMCIRDRCSLS